MTTKQQKVFTVRLAKAPFRTGMFEGREHLIVPVVALVEGVLYASNAEGPEFVPATTFERSVAGWNGEPVMFDHPGRVANKITANDPSTLENFSFGRVFNAHVENGKLMLEAWLDPLKATRIGAHRIIERIKQDDTVEVSVGAFVTTDNTPGNWNGEAYIDSWTELVPDHLAMLPDGTPGACSVEMGCGAPRAAAAKPQTTAPQEGDGMKHLERVRLLLRKPCVAKGDGVVSALLSASDEELTRLEALAEKGELGKSEPWYTRLLGSFRHAESTSDVDLRGLLGEALMAEAGFVSVDTVFPDESIVVYAVQTGERMLFHRRSYTLTDGVVTVGDTVEEVIPVTRFEPVTTPEQPVVAASGRDATVPHEPAKEEDMTKKERVAALIASGKTCFTAADASVLEQLPDERLAALEAHVPTPAPALTPEQYLAQAPDSIKAEVNEARAAKAKKRAELIAAAKATKQEVFSDDELNALPTGQLEKVVRLAAAKPQLAVDNSGRPLPREASSDEKVPPPPSMRDRILAARK